MRGMRRLRAVSLICLAVSCTGLGLLLFSGDMLAVYLFSAVGLLGCAGMVTSGIHALCRLAGARPGKGGRQASSREGR